jgi:hypothetical protein
MESDHVFTTYEKTFSRTEMKSISNEMKWLSKVSKFCIIGSTAKFNLVPHFINGQYKNVYCYLLFVNKSSSQVVSACRLNWMEKAA